MSAASAKSTGANNLEASAVGTGRGKLPRTAVKFIKLPGGVSEAFPISSGVNAAQFLSFPRCLRRGQQSKCIRIQVGKRRAFICSNIISTSLNPVAR